MKSGKLLRSETRSPAGSVPFDPDEIDGIVAAAGRSADAVLPILHAIQARYNYLPRHALRRVCASTEITPAQITGVATFFSGFRLEPAGRHTIKVCIGTACHIKGADQVVDAFMRHLRIGAGHDTDPDGLFTVARVACLGCCMLAPAVQIDRITYGFISPQRVPQLLEDFLAAAGKQAPSPTGQRQDVQAGEVRLCLCSSCVAAGADTVETAIRETVEANGLCISVKITGCTGISYAAPLVEIEPAGDRPYRYGRVRAGDAGAILARHFRPGRVFDRLRAAGARLLEKLYTDEAWEPATRYLLAAEAEQPGGRQADSLHWGRQKHIATAHAGALAPLDLQAYRDAGGFEALTRCTSDLSPNDIIAVLEDSGLRGRGGAGFFTARKWRGVREAAGTPKYLIGNGDEGDPGAFMDRMILESFPFRVIEGMAIGAAAIGARQCFLYIRAEYPLALSRMRQALELCRAQGLIGDEIAGSAHDFHLEIVEGAGAFVCGEETALIAAIEGRRATPRLRPPYPEQEGLWGRPTLINNIETFALVPWIIRNGAQRFAEMGTENSRGTKTFALAGKITRGGLIEVPMGITLREIVEDIGGGVQGAKRLKAVQVGGPSGGCIPGHMLGLTVDYEALVTVGAMMGSGGLVVLDETDCMVDIARYFMAFTQAESCGQCTPCRIGTTRMLAILEALCRGDATSADLERLEHLARLTGSASLCGLGRTAPNPVLTTLEFFREEYEAHTRGQCPARRCKALISYTIGDSCIGCTRCAQRCPSDAIDGTPYERHSIDADKCVRCDTCRQACPVGAVCVESAGR